MENPKKIRQYLIAALLIGSMGLYTSCDSCNRVDGNKEGTEDGRDVNGDTRGSESPSDNEDSGSTPGTNTNAGSSSDNSSASTTTSGTGSRKLTQDEITNQVENSNASKAVDSNGDPIRSSGTSGAGLGTGTGSTGNNSKVTSREDQKS